jgi:autotransporter-associated beta strand protein
MFFAYSQPATGRKLMKRTKSFTRIALAASIALASASFAQSQTYIHVNAAGNWDTPASWGTNPDNAFPNAMGAVAEFSVAQTATFATTQNVAGGVTIGTINYAPPSGNFRRDINMTNGITMDQDGAGSGTAKIINAGPSGNGIAIYLNGTSPLTLADDLEVISSGSSSNGNGAIYLDSPVVGTGSITFDSNSTITTASTFATNAVHRGIRLMRTNSFSGNVLIKRGIVISTGALPTISISGETSPTTPLGGTGNTVTLGETGSGNAALISAVNSSTFVNPIIVAPTASGELRFLGSNSTSSYVIASGDISLGADLSIRSAGSGTHTYSGLFSGTGGIARYGTGIVRLSNTGNTFTGKISVNNGFISGESFNSVNGGTPLLASSSLGAPTTVANGTIGLGATTVAGGLIYTGTGETTDRVIDLGGTTGGGSIYSRGTGAITFTSDFTATGDGAKTLLLTGSNTHDNTISGKIVDSAGGATSVSKGADGITNNKWVLSGDSTYTGKTSIQAGTLQVTSLNSVNGGTPLLAGSALGAPATVADGTIDIGATTNVATLIYTGAGETTDRVVNLAGTTVGATILADGTGALTFTSDFTATVNGDKTLTLGGASTVNNTISGALANPTTGVLSLAKQGAGTWVLGGTNLYTGDTTVSAGTLNITGSHSTGTNYSVNAGSNLITNNIRVANALTVDGIATVNADGGTAGASKVETLTINPGGQLNLKNNDLVVGTSTLTVVRDQIKLGLSGVSNTAAAAGITSDMMTVGVHGFGYALGDDVNRSPLIGGPGAGGTLAGQTYDADSVLVKFTYRGDADLDGDSDLDDLGFWANSFTGDLGLGPVAAPTTLWTQGDWDYDGDTDLDDLGFWSSTFTGDLGGGGLSVYAPNASEGAIAALAGMGITAVPEPGSIILVGTALIGLPIFRRRRI